MVAGVSDCNECTNLNLFLNEIRLCGIDGHVHTRPNERCGGDSHNKQQPSPGESPGPQ